jgi:hypothetical protein
MGPQAPIPGVQDGVTIESIKGLMPIWQTKDQQGANQDGVTFQGAVYDPIVVDMVCEMHGNTPQSARKVIRRWIESWDVKAQGELFTICDNAYWFAPVRWFKTPTETLMRAASCRQRFTWTARADDGFWRSYDSVCEFGSGLSNAVQRITLKNSPTGGNWVYQFGGKSTGNIARTASAATLQTAITGLSSVGAGNATVTGSGPWDVTFIGALGGVAQPKATTTDTLTGGIFPFAQVDVINTGGTGQGFNTVTNIGDQEAWADHVVYGPFDQVQIANGPGGSMITFGPLLQNQIVLLRTEPRRRGVYDLTIIPPPGQALNPWQTFLKNLISFAMNGNIPPLLREFESWFGILPPQAELYSLLGGRFSNSIPAKAAGGDPVESHIAVKIVGGGAGAKIVTSITPRRRYPF